MADGKELDLKLSREIFDLLREKLELPDNIKDMTLTVGVRSLLTVTATFYPVRKGNVN